MLGRRPNSREGEINNDRGGERVRGLLHEADDLLMKQTGMQAMFVIVYTDIFFTLANDATRLLLYDARTIN